MSNKNLRLEAGEHFPRLARLLDLESEAQAQATVAGLARLSPSEAEQEGQSLIGLVIRDEDSGLGGRVLLTLGKRNAALPLPWTLLNPGSPALLREEGSSGAPSRAVVSRRDENSIQIALDEAPEAQSERATFRLDRSTDEAARLRQRDALDRARNARSGRLAELRDVLLGRRKPDFHPEPAVIPLDPGLNPSQLDAVRHALSAEDVAVIHGPPGTGKTTTLCEVVRQAVRRGQRVLVCAPSNLAVDNLMELLVGAGETAVRLGHPARVLASLQECTLDALVDGHPDVRLARKLEREAWALRRDAAKWTRGKREPGERGELKAEARDLLADARRLEAQVVESFLDQSPILCATTTGLDSRLLGERRFDLVVLDEACQATEPMAWIPLVYARRIVLGGDPCQLPPTIVSPEAQKTGFGVSLQERLMELHGPGLARLLKVQYRMHSSLMEFSSGEFYHSELEAHASVRDHLLSDLPGVASTELTTTPLTFIDTAGASYDEELEPDGESRRNPQEAERACMKVRQLLEAGVAKADIMVITPYSAQVRLLREMLPSGVEADSVDGFQGREKEAVVISLVRSNAEGELGFLKDTRRMNVAWTRARRKLIVIGDSATVGGHPFYRRMLDYCEREKAYSTVWEEWA